MFLRCFRTWQSENDLPKIDHLSPVAVNIAHIVAAYVIAPGWLRIDTISGSCYWPGTMEAFELDIDQRR